MYIVRFKKDRIKHSVWNTSWEARQQISVLQGCGYKTCYWEEIDCDYPNGHYFV